MTHLDDAETAEVRDEYRRPLIVVTLPAALVIVLGLALVIGLGFWNYGRLRDQSFRAVARNTAADLARGQKADFDLCEAIGDYATTLRAVVDTAYMTANPAIDMSTLPPESQKLLIDLLPILGLYAESGQSNHDKVAAQVTPAPKCTRPGSASAPVVSSAPTTRVGTTTTVAR